MYSWWERQRARPFSSPPVKGLSSFVILPVPVLLPTPVSQFGFLLFSSVFVVCLQALWSRFLPAYRHMADVVRSGAIGDVKVVQASFGFSQPKPIDRLVKKELAGGAILDIGIYAVNVALMAFGDERPEKARRCNDMPNLLLFVCLVGMVLSCC